MRKFLISAALVGLVAAAAPAAAQYDYSRDRGYDDRYDQRYDRDYRGGQQIDRQLDNIVQRIDRAFQRRLISSSEARRLRSQADDIARLHDRYRRNGLSPREHQDLQYRIHNLRQRLQWERREGREERRWDDRRDRW